MKIALASDHRGFAFKEVLKKYLSDRDIEVEDFGARDAQRSDYMDYAVPASRSVIAGDSDRAILICGSGVGMCISANRIKGIRAAMVYNQSVAQESRSHSDSNVLCLGADEFSDEELLAFVDTWLDTEFSPDDKYARRLQKLEEI